MRKLVKKALTAGVLALMACTSMSAMAKPQLVYFGPYKIYEDWFSERQYDPNDLQGACELAIERRVENQGGRDWVEARNVQFLNL